jgi:hypothetical protein
MRLSTTILREPGEGPIPRAMLARDTRPRGRPKKSYRPLVQSARDVDRLRRHRLPVFLLTEDWVTRSGYPVRFRPWLVVAESIESSIETKFRVLPIRDADSLQAPGLPELVTLLLYFDPLAARAVATRNRKKIDRNELYRRVRNAGLERAATKVRLQQIVPGLPQVGEPLPLDDLEWVDQNDSPRTPNP